MSCNYAKIPLNPSSLSLSHTVFVLHTPVLAMVLVDYSLGQPILLRGTEAIDISTRKPRLCAAIDVEFSKGRKR